jgi:hypothetical protein
VLRRSQGRSRKGNFSGGELKPVAVLTHHDPDRVGILRVDPKAPCFASEMHTPSVELLGAVAAILGRG